MRRFWVTTSAFASLYVVSLTLLHVEGAMVTAFIFLLPVYLITLVFVLSYRGKKRAKSPKARLVERLDWQQRLMMGVAIFLGIYVPFTIVSSDIIPYAAIVEYGLFSLLLFFLLRLGGRSTGVASSLDALPPPTHRLHQQVISPLDDRHYQQTLWLNYNFIEKGKGAKQIAKRVEQVLDANGVPPAARPPVLAELEAYEGHVFRRAGRGQPDRDRRIQVLDRVFERLRQTLETTG